MIKFLKLLNKVRINICIEIGATLMILANL